MELYPIKFHPILVSKIWGGNKLVHSLHKPCSENNIGESWEISAIEGYESIVSNGRLAGINIKELIERYKEKLLGKHVIEKFGEQFPLLIKYIDAADDLSIQVHPDDVLAEQKHHSKGKTEMWYVIEAEKDAALLSGLKKAVDATTVSEAIEKGNFTELINAIPVTEGSTFFIPAGRIHAIGKGILLAEIQQSSDITYRLYDYNRIDKNGKKRELHIADSLEAINYQDNASGAIAYQPIDNESCTLASCQYFETNFLHITQKIQRDYTATDSFVILMNVGGQADITTQEGKISLDYGETLLIPAEIKDIAIEGHNTKLLEIYIR